jgi:hypothetical protein
MVNPTQSSQNPTLFINILSAAHCLKTLSFRGCLKTGLIGGSVLTYTTGGIREEMSSNSVARI